MFEEKDSGIQLLGLLAFGFLMFFVLLSIGESKTKRKEKIAMDMYCNIHGTTWNTDTDNSDACPSCSEEWVEVETNDEGDE